MRWEAVGDEAAADAARAFLRARERDCVAAVSRFLAAFPPGGNRPPGADRPAGSAARDRAWTAASEEGATASFLGRFGAIAFPVLGEERGAGGPARACARLLAGRVLGSAQGLERDVRGLEKALGRRAENIDYDLMELDGPPAAEALGAGPVLLRIRRASADDADALFPLQASYELEEVLPPGARFDAASSRAALRRLLETRLVLVAELGGEPVGKANVNASGFARDQIGGVYVLPALRGRGIGTRLCAELAAAIAEGGRGATLFVKKRNASARAAYARVGFLFRADYRIAYFGR